MYRQLAFLATLAAAPLLAQHTIDCGAEGMRSCNWKDWETYNMIYWAKKSCDADLKEADGVCVNDKRRQLGKPFTWTNWGIKQQLQSIGKDEPVNYLQWPGAHNAYSNSAQGFTNFYYRNQHFSITDLLNYGIRHIELDPHYYGASGRFDVRLCHGSSTGFCLFLGWETRLFASALIEINDWLAANPDEILMIKLDDKLTDFNAGSDGFTPLVNLIATHLGPRVFKYSLTNYAPANWPTPAEIRRFGKQVVITIHNSGPHRNEYLWDGKGRFLTSNWPKNQNFTTCTDSAGKTPVTRYILDWWDTAEGRSGSNFAGSLKTSNTGLFEPQWYFTDFAPVYPDYASTDNRSVIDAVRCGVSIVGLDYINALDNGVLYSGVVADTRLKEMVWSWKEDDYGRSGPAMFESASGRWVSKPPAESHPFACALKRPTFASSQARQWKVTPESRTYSPTVGLQLCQQYFGTNYEFAYPTNGFQQGELIKAVNTNAWLNYSVVPLSNLSVNPNIISATMIGRTSFPAPTSFTISGVAGTTLALDPSTPLPAWLLLNLPASLDANGLATAQVAFREPPSALPFGPNQAKLKIRSTLQASTSIAEVTVTLNIRRTSTVTLTAPTTVPWNSDYTVSGKVTVPGITHPEGQLNLLRAKPVEGGGYTTEIAEVGYLLSGNNQAGYFKFTQSSRVLPGEYVWAVQYDSSGNTFAETQSEPVFVTVRPRQATPSSLTFTMPRGGSLPAAQTVSMPGFTTPNTYYTSPAPCDWITATTGAGTATVSVRSGAASLAAGEYNCTLQFKDAETGLGGYFEVPATLRVTTTLSASPQEINLIGAVNGPAVRAALAISTGGNVKIPVTLSSDSPWLNIASGQDDPNAPMPTASVIATPANQTGSRSGFVTISSPLASNSVTVRVNLNTVQATVVGSIPAGMPIRVDGVTYSNTTTFAWPGGTQHTIEALGSPAAQPDTRLGFSSWSTNAITPAITYTASPQGGSLFATYAPQYRLTTSVVPTAGGSIRIQPASVDGFYPNNSEVQLTAVPAEGWEFDSWMGALTGTVALRSVPMTAPRSVTAVFRQITGVDLSISSATPGVQASVLVNGARYALPATVKVNPGSSVTVVAEQPLTSPNAVSRFQFASWGAALVSATQTFTMPSTPTSLSVNYKTQHLVAVTPAPANAGTVSGNGWYDAGTFATVQAAANAGFTFTGFAGGLTGLQNPQTVSVTAPVSATANFGSSGRPSIAITSAPSRASNAPGFRTVPLTIFNLGPGAAMDARITGIQDVAVVSGIGQLLHLTPVPIELGAMAPNSSVARELQFNWPESATRVRFTLSWVANGGTASGFTTLTLFR